MVYFHLVPCPVRRIIQPRRSLGITFEVARRKTLMKRKPRFSTSSSTRAVAFPEAVEEVLREPTTVKPEDFVFMKGCPGPREDCDGCPLVWPGYTRLFLTTEVMDIRDWHVTARNLGTLLRLTDAPPFLQLYRHSADVHSSSATRPESRRSSTTYANGEGTFGTASTA